MNNHVEPTVLTVFGAGGDLTKRKILPAIWNLYLDGFLPDKFAVIGVDRVPLDDAQFRDRARAGVDDFSRQPRGPKWDAFVSRFTYLKADFTDPKSYAELADWIDASVKAWGGRPSRVYYLATAPSMIEVIADKLQAATLTSDVDRDRIVVEKPFGHDLDSAMTLNRNLGKLLDEKQIYRIDHYLGKETVQNMLVFRFANALFEPIWNRIYIDHVQVTVAEEVGVEKRGGYYDRSGALRDMIQNHLLQVLCLVAMEPPVDFGADEVRSKKVDVLRAIRHIPKDQVAKFAVRGQYGPGSLDGKQVPGYRQEPDVAPNSSTETFAAMRLFVDNWRWQGVPFYLRTGKHMQQKASEVVVQFRRAPHRSFPASCAQNLTANRLYLRIQPQEGILLGFHAKHPGATMQLQDVKMLFQYRDFNVPSPEAYETLLLDVMRADATLFMRADQTECAWKVVMPVLENWLQTSGGEFPNYAAGTWGPAAADKLIEQDGRSWLEPSVVQESASGKR